MWISRGFYRKSIQPPEIGTITVSGNAGAEASATAQTKSVSLYSPYGYSYCAPRGEEVLLVNSALGAVGSGMRMKRSDLSAGEIEISSLGGARIILKNDGSVCINGYTFLKDGTVKNKEGEFVKK